MKIKGMEYEFFCAKCKGIISDSPSTVSEGKTHCNCNQNSNAGTGDKKYNGVRFNKE